jgi:hypothetical protein
MKEKIALFRIINISLFLIIKSMYIVLIEILARKLTEFIPFYWV